MLAMVVVTPVRNELPHAKEGAKPLERGETNAPPASLRTRKTPESRFPVAASASAIVLTHEADREASFSVYETAHPATLLGQSFLLIVRTRHVVTIVNVPSDGHAW
jgi:hypothetical protein